MNNGYVAGSFRDPSGFLFHRDGVLYRQVNASYQQEFDHLLQSGLYQSLVDAGMLVPHVEVELEAAAPEKYKIIRPETVRVISYPYEWCFSQLKEAALTTLKIQKMAMKSGMILKDASAYNIQFHNGKPVLIDTLSFELYKENQPWTGYRQFCQHFLAPLSLMAFTDMRLGQLLRTYIDGIPLDLASSLLPFRTKLSFSLLSNIHLHAKSQHHFGDRKINTKSYRMTKFAMEGLIDNLQAAIRKLQWHPPRTEWGNYYEDTNYSDRAFQQKKQFVNEILDRVQPRSVADLGANTGVFSRLASSKNIFTLSIDGDPAAVEQNYLESKKSNEKNLLPLWIDLTNPSAASGWDNEERSSWSERCKADCVFALALIHHLAISNNVPFWKLAKFFSKLSKFLIIEFVPKSDSQVQRLLASRQDIFHSYSQEAFEVEFQKYFRILHHTPVSESERVLYCMEAKVFTAESQSTQSSAE